MQTHFAILLLFVSISTISALKCYVCNENDNAACADPDRLKKFLKECPETEDPYCRKIVQVVDEQTRVVRTCGTKTGAKACYKTAGKNNANVCSCNTDGCNHGLSSYKNHIWMPIVGLVISLVMFR